MTGRVPEGGGSPRRREDQLDEVDDPRQRRPPHVDDQFGVENSRPSINSIRMTPISAPTSMNSADDGAGFRAQRGLREGQPGEIRHVIDRDP